MKRIIYRSERYLEFTRQQPCIVTGQVPSDPHHAVKGGGMGLKCTDLGCIPLTRLPHGEVDSRGQKSFQEHYGLDFKDALIINLMKYVCYLEGHNPDDYDWPLSF